MEDSEITLALKKIEDDLDALFKVINEKGYHTTAVDVYGSATFITKARLSFMMKNLTPKQVGEVEDKVRRPSQWTQN